MGDSSRYSLYLDVKYIYICTRIWNVLVQRLARLTAENFKEILFDGNAENRGVANVMIYLENPR